MFGRLSKLPIGNVVPPLDDEDDLRTSFRREPGTLVANFKEMAGMIANGKLTPRISQTHVMDDFAAAFEAITSRKAMGKVVLTMD